ncbi:MAG: hypothetical protein ACJ76Z_07345 [Thermoleophilaceae bacterium]
MGSRLAAAAAALVVAGCGGGPGSDEHAARQVVNRWLDAMAGRDDRRACAQLTTRLQKLIDLQLRQLGHTKLTCRNFAARWAFEGSAAGDSGVRIARLDVRGKTATVQLVADGRESRIRLRKQNGQWRVDNYN